jgi:hypothetical protein
MTELGGQLAERDMLTGFLDWYRGVVCNKLGGLTREQATRAMTPSGLSLLSVVSHLSGVEYGWFDEKFLGNQLSDAFIRRHDFFVGDADTVESVLGEYRDACAYARKVVAEAPSLDETGKIAHPVFGEVTLRWIMVHMIDETARHAGHMDIMRELVDGRTGD